MLNAIYPEICWEDYQAIGFDLDGTLYDEFEFIEQVFNSIVDILLYQFSYSKKSKVFRFMINRWLEKGSSYPFIFKEAAKKMCIGDEEAFEDEALKIFRNFMPSLTLSARSRHILIAATEHHKVFILTDGNPELQLRKIKVLGVDKLIDPKNIFFTGTFGLDKASKKIALFIPRLRELGNVVFFGDRNADAILSDNLGYYFKKVNNTVSIG